MPSLREEFKKRRFQRCTKKHACELADTDTRALKKKKVEDRLKILAASLDLGQNKKNRQKRSKQEKNDHGWGLLFTKG